LLPTTNKVVAKKKWPYNEIHRQRTIDELQNTGEKKISKKFGVTKINSIFAPHLRAGAFYKNNTVW